MSLNGEYVDISQAQLLDADLTLCSDAELAQVVEQLTAMSRKLYDRLCVARQEQLARLPQGTLPF